MDVVEEAYVAWRLLEEAEPVKDALGVHELRRFITERDYQLTAGQTARLFASPVLRESFAALKAAQASAKLPML